MAGAAGQELEEKDEKEGADDFGALFVAVNQEDAGEGEKSEGKRIAPGPAGGGEREGEDKEINSNEGEPNGGQSAEPVEEREDDFVETVFVQVGLTRETESGGRGLRQMTVVEDVEAFGELPPKVDLPDVKGGEGDTGEECAGEERAQREVEGSERGDWDRLQHPEAG